jgi:hypothetical protein
MTRRCLIAVRCGVLEIDIEARGSPLGGYADRPVIRKKGTTGPEKDQIGASLEERAHHATLLAWD